MFDHACPYVPLNIALVVFDFFPGVFFSLTHSLLVHVSVIVFGVLSPQGNMCLYSSEPRGIVAVLLSTSSEAGY